MFEGEEWSRWRGRTGGGVHHPRRHPPGLHRKLSTCKGGNNVIQETKLINSSRCHSWLRGTPRYAMIHLRENIFNCFLYSCTSRGLLKSSITNHQSVHQQHGAQRQPDWALYTTVSLFTGRIQIYEKKLSKIEFFSTFSTKNLENSKKKSENSRNFSGKSKYF